MNPSPTIPEREIYRSVEEHDAPRIDWRDDRGQTTAEYGLVLLAAATIAMLVVAWAGGTGAINGFFDAIIDKITSLIA